MSTTRVDATFNASRKRVTNNSTVGKIANSSGRLTLNTAMTMTSDSAMLNVNSTSSITGGSGRIIIARMDSRPSGTPMPERIMVAKAEFSCGPAMVTQLPAAASPAARPVCRQKSAPVAAPRRARARP
jgi:hypothetical protein